MFSVIIPAYNAAPFIQNSIGSVLAQTVSDFEILVVDDGSKDDTGRVVAGIGDLRIRYIYQENAGVSAARNKGILNAKGEYVCFLDADDLWKPYHLEVLSRMIDKFPTCGVFLTGHEILLHSGKTIRKACSGVAQDLQSDNVFRHIWDHGYFIHTNSVACKTSVFDSVGLFEVGVKNGEDDDMWYRLFAYYSAGISNEITTTYIRENSRATVSKIFVEDWVFLRRVDEIMASTSIPVERKNYLQRLLEQRKLSFVRQCILKGDKKNAGKNLLRLRVRLLKPKKYLETLISFLIPSKILERKIENRDKEYYQQ